MDPAGGDSPPGRARGRARGTVRGQHQASPIQPAGLLPPERVSPPGGRMLEPRMGDLSLHDIQAPADEIEHLSRYGGGNGGNGNGNGNGNGGNGNGNGNGSRQGDDEEMLGREGIWLQARAQMMDRTAERYDFVRTTTDNTPTKVGTQGDTVKCFANYFHVNTGAEWRMHHYRVDFLPVVDDTKCRRNILRVLRGTEGFGQFIFDGHSMWRPSPLSGPLERDVTLPDSQDTYRVTFKLAGILEPGDPQYLQFYNNVTRTCLRLLKLCSMGRNYFDPTAEVVLANYNLKLWPGFVTTLRYHDGKMMYCVELTNKVIRMDSVWAVMKQARSEANQRNTDYKAAIKSEVVGSIVLTMYNNRTYKVDDISWDENVNSTFQLADGTTTSFKNYYSKYTSHSITYDGQPLLISNPTRQQIRIGRTDPIKLIPELCQMTGLTEKMRGNFTMMKEMGNYLFQPPQQKFDSTVAFIRRLLANERVVAELTGWGLEIRVKPVEVVARIVPPEAILTRDKRNPTAKPLACPIKDGDFTNAFRGGGFMMRTIRLSNWVVILTQRDNAGLENLLSTMNKVAGNLDFGIARPTEIIHVNGNSPDIFSNGVTQAKTKHKDLQLVFVILPSNRLDVYSAVKKRCYIDYGIPSQCFLSKNVSHRGLMSIATKVVIQMTAKLGGECWGIQIPMKGTMVIGFDVHHGGPGSRGGSIGAMVCTTNPEFLTYYSTASIFHAREELSSNMSRDISKCIHAYRNVNKGALPEKIIFYRDGVGDGQLGYVFRVELASIKEMLKTFYAQNGKDVPGFTMIICTKRINTRVFLSTGGRNVENCKPGTVIDTMITLPYRWDFFLIAQVARQGVVSPTNYNVIYDTNGLNADKVQRLTYKLCHLYYNWSGGVAVPSVVQYAHKMAFLTGTALGTPGIESLGHTLYYL